MTRFKKYFAATALVTGMAVAVGAQSGNGAFLTGFRAIEIGVDKKASAQFEIHCNTGFSCGLANVEVDWDDGSAIDFINGYVYPLSQDNPLEEEFIHQYASNGLYHGQASIDDDQGNWWAQPFDMQIVN